jgi:hypothetical protein
MCRSLLASTGLLASVNFASAQTPSEPPATPPVAESSNQQDSMQDPQTGGHWTYEIRDDISGDVKSTITQTVTDVSPTEISIRVGAPGKFNTGYLTFDRSWDVVDNSIWHYSPNDGTG